MDPAAAMTAMIAMNRGSSPPRVTCPRNPDNDAKTTTSAVVPIATLGSSQAEPVENGEDEITAAHAEKPAQEPGDGTDAAACGDLGRARGFMLVPPHVAEEHHKAGEDEKPGKQPEEQSRVHVGCQASANG